MTFTGNPACHATKCSICPEDVLVFLPRPPTCVNTMVELGPKTDQLEQRFLKEQYPTDAQLGEQRL